MITTIRKILEPITDPGPNPNAVVALMEDRYLSRMPGISQDTDAFFDDLPAAVTAIEEDRDAIIDIESEIDNRKNIIPEQTQFFVSAIGQTVTETVTDTPTTIETLPTVSTRRGDIIVVQGVISIDGAATPSAPSLSINNTSYAALSSSASPVDFLKFEAAIARKSAGNIDYSLVITSLSAVPANQMNTASGAITTATDTLTGDNLDIELWGQESASTSRDYTVRQSSVYVKRNAVEQNLVLQSEALNETGVWNRTQLEDVADSGIAAPTIDGESFGNYWKIIPNTTDAAHQARQFINLDGAFEMSVLARADGYDSLRIILVVPGDTNAFMSVELATGDVLASSGPIIKSSVVEVASGEWLISMLASAEFTEAIIRVTDGLAQTFPGNGTDGILVTRVHITEDDRAPYAKTTTDIVDPLAP